MQNAEVVGRFLGLINAQELSAALTLVADGAELDWSASEAPDSGRYRGPEEWGRWLAGRQEGLGEARFEATELRDVTRDQVLLVAYMHGQGRASGLAIQALGAGIITVGDGMITGLRMYQTRAEALQALGLEE
jgi:ketosteroid isomerase-like protein